MWLVSKYQAFERDCCPAIAIRPTRLFLWQYWHYLLEAAGWDIALSSYDQDRGWDYGYRALGEMLAVYPLLNPFTASGA